MDSTTDNCYVLRLLAQQSRAEGHEQTQIPQETMLEILLWLDRFDLDGKQITARRLRHLVENNPMPLRTVRGVNYSRLLWSVEFALALSIEVLIDEEDEPDEIVLYLDTDVGVQKAVSYLSSCFVSPFNISYHEARMLYTCPDRRAIITAPALIGKLTLRGCDFDSGDENTLSETLRVCTFQRLELASPIPVWQITDKLLESLRLRGCTHFYEDYAYANADEKSDVTEEGILSFCFTLDDDMPMPEWRCLKIEHVNITPAFFNKLVQASKSSRLTCGVELWLNYLPFDVSNLVIGVPPSRILAEEGPPEYHYNMDHGNGIRLEVHFESCGRGGVTWDVAVRHAKKDCEEPHDDFFGSQPEEEQNERAAPEA